MLNRLLQGLRLCCGEGSHQSFLLAVSGGSDSMAMLHLFVEAREKLGLRLEVAHFHHGLRGGEADADADFVRAECEKLGIPFHFISFDVAKFASKEKLSIEAAGRRLRRHFFERLAKARKLDWIALAHTKDDLAETVLMNFLRGAGARGLAGIPATTGHFIHPLLSFSKAELMDYLQSKGLAFREDSTNQDLRYFRNKIRHHILPYLEGAAGESVKENLLQMAAIFRDEEKWMEEAAAPLFTQRFLPLGFGVFELRIAAGELPAALRRRLLRRALFELLGSLEGVGFSAIEEMGSLLNKGTGKRVEFAKLLVERTENGLAFSTFSPKWKEEVLLPVPGKVNLTELGVWVKATILQCSSKDGAPRGENFVDLDQVRAPLILRTRRDGDRFHPPGMSGKKKLQDYFVDKKIPKILRDRIPLLARPDGLVWIAGHGADRRAAVTADTQKVLRLEFGDQ